MRVGLLSSISDVSPGLGLTASSESALPFQLTVIEPPADEYVLVNGAGPCGASDVELLLLLLDDELDELLDEARVGGGLVGVACPPTVAAGGEPTVVPGVRARTVVVGAVGVVDVDAGDWMTEVTGTPLVVGSTDVVGAGEVSVASDVDGCVAGASVSSPLPPLTSRTPAPTTTISVARPATPARRRLMPRARASTAS